ncbi:MAG: N-acetylmuramic acid 6-phosphate etherase [Bacteroidetes bacterium]|nr:N-acetylmuramic acid 6-phosphate etherase [Bacteroidota bacterium]
MEKTTEKASNYNHLEKMSTQELLAGINNEDALIAHAVSQELKPIENLVDATYSCLQIGGRLFYLGSGTSGRLGILDASECPPTFGVEHDLVIGLIAGGDAAIRKAQEFAEDDMQQGFKDLQAHNVSVLDMVVGLSASGTTPYVLGALKTCKEKGISTGFIGCNKNSPIGFVADYRVEVVVGPEFVTGSTRMKSGTAQKMVLNMLTTSVMIKLGRVKGNKMVDMALSNDKLVDRGTRMLIELYGWEYARAKAELLAAGGVRDVIKKMEQ